MKTDVPTKRDGKDFQRFDSLLKTVIIVPKKDIQKAEERKKKANAKKKS